MGMGRFRSSNPNEIGTEDLVTHVYTKRTNHSFGSLGPGSDPLATGYSTFGDGTFTSTFPASQFSLIWTAREEAALLSKMLNKFKGHELNLGVSLAEVDKLADTVLGTLRNLVYGLDDLRKLRFTAFARRFGTRPPRKDRVDKLRLLDISGRFLEMRYAWQPAIQDVYESAKAFEQLSSGPRQSYTRTTKRRERKVTYFTNYGVGSQVVEAKRTYLFEMYEEMGFARQLGLSNPASILWERLPWSFVIDWFIPIGTYLELVGQIPFMKGRWCRTSSIKWTASGVISTAFPGAPFLVVAPLPDGDWERFHLERSISAAAPPVPKPTFKVAGAVQGKRLQNAIALAHQVFSGSRRSVRTTFHY